MASSKTLILQQANEGTATKFYQSYTLVLLDGNRYIFLEEFFKAKAQGGADAARLLMSEVQKLHPGTDRVRVCICLDFKRLSQKHRKALIGLQEHDIIDFAQGFSWPCTSFDMVDVPGRRELARQLRDLLRRHLSDPTCEQILLGCRSEQVESLLSPYLRDDPPVEERVAYVEAVELVEGIWARKLPVVRFDALFRKVLLAGDR
ncbi:hypothetical protein MMC07_009256 [Pseudocyphellaria aurata]|nr:hypothetical protein [Pseudocyphellaria aurata]